MRVLGNQRRVGRLSIDKSPADLTTSKERRQNRRDGEAEATMTNDERMQRESNLIATVRKTLPTVMASMTITAIVANRMEGQDTRRRMSEARAAPLLMSGTMTNSRTVTSES